VLAPRRAVARFEDDGPSGAALLHDALRRLRARLGASPAAEPVGAHRAAGAEQFCWRSRSSRGSRTSPGSSSARA